MKKDKKIRYKVFDGRIELCGWVNKYKDEIEIISITSDSGAYCSADFTLFFKFKQKED